MIEEDFTKFLEEQLGKIVDEKGLDEYCYFSKKCGRCLAKCSIYNICEKHRYHRGFIKNTLKDLKILQRKSKLEKLLK